MDHILVMPMHDPQRRFFPLLELIAPILKEAFSGTVISIAPMERSRLLEDGFFKPVVVPMDLPVGLHFHELYRHAAEAYPPESVLHLCFIDRLAFHIESRFRETFLEDIRGWGREDLPLIFQRSPAAWATHPRNYREIEGMISTVGEWVYGKRLDFAWCHIAVEAGRLKEILPAVRRPDLSMVAEIIVQLYREIHTKDVDWLAWEDPFILGLPAEELKREREGSLEETCKRLSYALPMMDVLYKALQWDGRIFPPELGEPENFKRSAGWENPESSGPDRAGGAGKGVRPER
jgi:hypothetical protein